MEDSKSLLFCHLLTCLKRSLHLEYVKLKKNIFGHDKKRKYCLFIFCSLIPNDPVCILGLNITFPNRRYPVLTSIPVFRKSVCTKMSGGFLLRKGWGCPLGVVLRRCYASWLTVFESEGDGRHILSCAPRVPNINFCSLIPNAPKLSKGLVPRVGDVCISPHGLQHIHSFLGCMVKKQNRQTDKDI